MTPNKYLNVHEASSKPETRWKRTDNEVIQFPEYLRNPDEQSIKVTF